jgi:phosphatidylglycerophosphate synthase
MRYVNRWLGRRLAALGFVMRLTPNGVTALSGLATLSGLLVLLLVPVGWLAALTVTALLLLGFALDSADGQLARLTDRGGPAGEWLDHVVDSARQPLIHIGLAAHWLTETDLDTVVVAAVTLGFLLVTSVRFFSQTLAEQLLRNHAGPTTLRGGDEAWRGWVQLPADPGVLYLSFLLLPVPRLLMLGYLTLLIANLALFGASLVRRYRDLARLTAGSE